MTKKNIISLLVLAILVLAIPIIVTLVRQQQTLKSRASADPIEFKKSDGSAITESEGGLPLTRDRNIMVVLNNPQSSTSPTPTPSPTPSPTTSPTPSPTPSPAGNRFVQIMVLDDGKQAINRECPADPAGPRGANFGPNFDLSTCTGWSTGYNVANDTSLPQSFRTNGINSWHEYFFTDPSNNRRYIEQIMVNKDGKQVANRQCDSTTPRAGQRGADFGPNFDLSTCTGWSTGYNVANDTSLPQSFRDGGILSWDEYFFTENGRRFIEQIYVHADGKQVANRQCDSTTPRPGQRGADFGPNYDLSTCTGWSTGYNVANDTSLPQSIRTSGISHWHEYFYTDNSNRRWLVQIMVSKDGKQAANRQCNSTNPRPGQRGADFGPNFDLSTCTGWSLGYNTATDTSFPAAFRGRGINTWVEYFYP